jgi:hypothetical protein
MKKQILLLAFEAFFTTFESMAFATVIKEGLFKLNGYHVDSLSGNSL